MRLQPIVLACALALTLHSGLSLAGVAPGRAAVTSPSSPSLMLANVYRPSIALQDYWVSEKYDGVRA